MQTIKFSGEFFSVEDTLQCGQTFRFKKYLEGYLVISQDKICYAYNKDGYAYIQTEYPEYFSKYFDLSNDYSKIVSTAYSYNIPILNNAVNYGKGIRILKQNSEEMLYHFIISQNNNIPRIKNTIEKIAQKYGKRINSPFGEYYAFPTSKEFSTLSSESLNDVGLGYRLPYILEVAKKIHNGLDLNAFDLLDENYLEKIIIRDPNDQIILNSAVENNVDYLLTGDKDFLVLNIQNPKCVSINEMIEILNIKIKV